MGIYQPSAGGARQFAPARLFLAPSLLERLAHETKTLAEIAAIEFDGPLEACRLAVDQGCFEFRRVDLDARWNETQVVALDQDSLID